MLDSAKRLNRKFFLKDAIALAKDLLGKIIVRQVDKGVIKCRIVETEAYMGPDDKGSHAYKGKKTKRTIHFWNSGGHLYVPLTYGIHYCLNIIANTADKPEGVLIRAVEPLEGVEIIKTFRDTKKMVDLTNGPGKVTSSLNIHKDHNSLDLCDSEDVYLEDDGFCDFDTDRSVRIGIDYAEEYIYKPWRFFVKDNSYVSKAKLKYEYVDD
jgi:DNA-3-methyladenine glycosylase